MSILEHKKLDKDTDAAPAIWLPNKPGATVRTYRGKSLEALLPKIKKDLGPDAVILREREGLMGGVGGFFATRFVEVEARAGVSIDVYDEDGDDDVSAVEMAGDEMPELVVEELEATTELPALPASDLPELPAPSDFSAKLQAAVEAWSAEADADVVLEAEAITEAEVTIEPDVLTDTATADLPAPAPKVPVLHLVGPPADDRSLLPAMRATPPAVDSEAVSRLEDQLVELGVSERFAREVIAAATAHGPAVAGGLRAAVRAEIARRLTSAPTLPAQGAAVAFVGTGGSGKSLATAALAATYRYGSALPVSVTSLCDITDQQRLADTLADDGVPVTELPDADDPAEAESLSQIAADRQSGMVIIDTPTAGPADAESLSALQKRLSRIAPDAVYVVLSATLGAAPARRALAGLAPLSPAGIVISHADETDQLGVLIELAATQGLPIVYVTAGADHRRSLIGADPHSLAETLLS